MRDWFDGVDFDLVRRRAAVVGGGLAVVVLAIVALIVGGGSRPVERLAVGGRSVSQTTVAPGDAGTATTLPLHPLTTGVPVPDAVEAPPPTARPSASPGAPRPGSAALPGGGGALASTAPGTVFGAAGSVLRPPAHATEPRKIDKGKGCHSAGDKGWSVRDCGALRSSGGVLVWVVETKEKSTKVLVLREHRQDQWTVELSATDAGGRQFAGVRAHGADVTGDGQPELAFGFRRTGPERVLSLDVVDAGGTVTLHRDLPGGSVRLGGGEVGTWAAAGDGSFQHDTLRSSGGQWRAVASERADRSAVPPSMV